jgi:protocatechuate 3,4-dioxygenase beta subunit
MRQRPNRKPFVWALSVKFSLLITFLSISLIANGQAGQAALTGIIQDASGAVVTGAKVTLTSKLTGQTVELVTDSSGAYTFTNVKPGTYSLAAEGKGFKRLTHDGIRLSTGETVRLDLQLVVGGADEIG